MYFIERTTIAANLLRQIGLASICEYSFGMFFLFLSIIFQFPERVRPLLDDVDFIRPSFQILIKFFMVF